MISRKHAAMALLTPFAAIAVGLVVAAMGCLTGCNQTRLSSPSDQKLVAIERFAEFELQDCAVDAGTCRAAQIRVLATSIDCAAKSVRADGKTGPVDAGAACAVAP